MQIQTPDLVLSDVLIYVSIHFGLPVNCEPTVCKVQTADQKRLARKICQQLVQTRSVIMPGAAPFEKV